MLITSLNEVILFWLGFCCFQCTKALVAILLGNPSFWNNNSRTIQITLGWVNGTHACHKDISSNTDVNIRLLI